MVDGNQGLRLCHRPTKELEREIVRRFWPSGEPNRGSNYDTYFDYYHRTCKSLYLGVRNEAQTLAIGTHEDVLCIVDCLWSNATNGADRTRGSLCEEIREKYFPGELDVPINASIDFTLRLWLTMNIREQSPASLYTASSWNDQSTLANFVKAQFKGPEIERSTRIALGLGMTAVNLERVSGLKIVWTDKLENHLYYKNDQRILEVYRLEHVLQSHLTSHSGIIPEKVISETLLSLHLLYPDWDPSTAKYLRKIAPGFLPSAPSALSRQMYLTDFHYWQDRLAEVLFESQSPPTTFGSTWPTLRLLWNDRRNPHQWWTFWFAAAILLLTIVFGFITAIATCMQTRYTYQSLQLAQEAAASLPAARI